MAGSGRVAKRLKRISISGHEEITPLAMTVPRTQRAASEGDVDEGDAGEGLRPEKMTGDSEEDGGEIHKASLEKDRNGDDLASIYAPSRFPRRLEARPNLTVVGDSIMEEGSIDLAASTRSLMELYLDYNEENGRRYCGTYFMPNDELEQTRQYLSHHVYLHIFNGEPTTVPLDNPKLILDIGTGTGDWATQMGEKFPGCEVIGTDISAIQSTCPPNNVFFEIEDAELPWLRQPDSVDLIHMRNMSGAFRDWRFIYEQAFECLRPGGYIEMHEYDDDWKGFFESFPPGSAIHNLSRDVYLGSIKSGRPRGLRHVEEGYLEEAGFVDVMTRTVEIPIMAETGAAGNIWLIVVVDGLEAMSLRLLTKYMGWDPDVAKRSCEEAAHMVARHAKDPEKSKRMVARVRIVTGRKPEPEPPAAWDHHPRDRGSGSDLGSISEATSVPADGTPVASIADGVEARSRVDSCATEIGLNGAAAEGATPRARASTATMDEVPTTFVANAMEVDDETSQRTT